MADETAASNPTAPDTTVDVNAPGPAPIATQPSQPSSEMVAQPTAPPAGPAPIAAAAATPPVETPHENLAVKVYHGIMGALGGTQDTSLQRDPQTGKMIVTQTPSGTGTQWKRMIAGVVQGTAAGLSVPGGPGQLTRAAGAGLNAGMEGAKDQQQQARQNADKDYDVQQQAIVRKAQTQALTYQGAVAAFSLSRMKVEAKVQDTDRENSFVKLIHDGGNGSQDLGVAQSFDDVLKMHKDMPNLMKENAQGNIVQVAHINEEGKFDGTRFALVTPQWKDARIDQDQSFYSLKPPTKIGDQPEIVKQTVKAGTVSNGDFVNKQTAAGNEILKWQADNKKLEDENTRAANVQKGETQRTAIKEAGENARLTRTLDSREELAKTKANAPPRAVIAAHDKDYVKPANDVEKSFNMMDHAYQEYKTAAAHGQRLPTGAQSMLALSTHLSTTFGNVKGSRVTKDMIEHHLGARGVTDGAQVAVQKIVNGDTLSPGQWDAFHDLIGESRFLSWETAAKEAKRKNIPIDFLPADLSQLGDEPKPGPPPTPAGAQAEVTDATGAVIGHVVNGEYVAIGKK